MAKAKTRKVVLKRFKFTKTGKVKRKNCNISHLSRKDDSSSKGRKKRIANVEGKFAKRIKQMVIK